MAAMQLAGCTGSGVPEAETSLGHAIGFSAVVADGGTRSAGDGELTTSLLRATGFGVYCWYTGSASFTTPATSRPDDAVYLLLMRNQKVEWDGDASQWTYAPARYWPMDPNERLTFRAYAPYVSYPLVSDAAGMPQLPVVVAATDFHNGTQHDPLWGTGTSGTPHRYGTLYDDYTYGMSGDGLTADAADGTIHWYFHHGMAKLVFRAILADDAADDDLVVTALRLSPLYTDGLLDISSPTASASEKPRWTDCSGDMEIELTRAGGDILTGVVLDKVTPQSILPAGVLIIPRVFGGTPLTVSIDYEAGGVAQTASAQLSPHLPAATVSGNTVYTYDLILDPSANHISVRVTVNLYWQVGSYNRIDDL